MPIQYINAMSPYEELIQRSAFNVADTHRQGAQLWQQEAQRLGGYVQSGMQLGASVAGKFVDQLQEDKMAARQDQYKRDQMKLGNLLDIDRMKAGSKMSMDEWAVKTTGQDMSQLQAGYNERLKDPNKPFVTFGEYLGQQQYAVKKSDLMMEQAKSDIEQARQIAVANEADSLARGRLDYQYGLVNDANLRKMTGGIGEKEIDEMYAAAMSNPGATPMNREAFKLGIVNQKQMQGMAAQMHAKGFVLQVPEENEPKINTIRKMIGQIERGEGQWGNLRPQERNRLIMSKGDEIASLSRPQWVRPKVTMDQQLAGGTAPLRYPQGHPLAGQVYGVGTVDRNGVVKRIDSAEDVFGQQFIEKGAMGVEQTITLSDGSKILPNKFHLYPEKEKSTSSLPGNASKAFDAVEKVTKNPDTGDRTERSLTENVANARVLAAGRIMSGLPYGKVVALENEWKAVEQQAAAAGITKDRWIAETVLSRYPNGDRPEYPASTRRGGGRGGAPSPATQPTTRPTAAVANQASAAAEFAALKAKAKTGPLTQQEKQRALQLGAMLRSAPGG